MRHARRTLLALAVVLATLLAVPGSAFGADAVTLAGSVVLDGQPAAGASVVVSVVGTDIAVATATDEEGAFSVDLEAGVGDQLTVVATGQTVRTGPDAKGCVRSETPTGRVTTTIETLPPDTVTVEMDKVISSTVCSATATPRPTARVTPPATDADGPGPGAAGAGLLLVLGMLALTTGGSLALAPRRR
jgi:hypothetical protein